MADSKITALTALTAADPANDMLPVVDVSDTSMAASGTTKRISINNILACSPSATLASATITGDLTVDTSTLKVDSANNRVGIGTASPAAALDIFGAFGTATAAAVIRNNSAASASNIAQVQFFTVNSFSGIEQVASIHGLNPNAASNNGGALVFSTSLNGTGTTPAERYRIENDGTATWSVGGSTAMTLNASGLGVGASPANDKLLSLGSIGILLSGATSDFSFRNSGGTAIQRLRYTDATGALTIGSATATAYPVELGGNTTTRAVTIDASSNVGIGVTPSAWGSNSKVLQVGSGSGAVSSTGAGSTSTRFTHGCYFDNTNWKHQFAGVGPSLYELTGSNAGSTHAWYIAAGGTVNTNIAFTQAMTLDASGNLILLSSNTPATLTTNGQLTVNATSNTNLRFSYRGSDGTTRVANITLA